MALYSTPNFGPERHDKVEQFEEFCVKKIHSAVLPGIPFKQLNIDDPVTLSKYQERVVISGIDWPTIQFDNSKNYHGITFKKLFSEKLTSFQFYKDWQKEDYQQFVFPVVSTPMLITEFEIGDAHGLMNEPVTYIIKSDCHKEPKDYMIIKLVDWYKYVLGEDSCRLI